MIKNELLSISGRYARLRFFKVYMMTTLVAFVLFALGGLVMASREGEQAQAIVGVASAFVFVVFLAALVLQMIQMIKRLHDLDKPGAWCLLSLLPLFNVGLFVYLVFFKGTPGPNRFGPDPLANQP